MIPYSDSTHTLNITMPSVTRHFAKQAILPYGLLPTVRIPQHSNSTVHDGCEKYFEYQPFQYMKLQSVHLCQLCSHATIFPANRKRLPRTFTIQHFYTCKAPAYVNTINLNGFTTATEYVSFSTNKYPVRNVGM